MDRLHKPRPGVVIGAAAVLMGIGMGTRASLGLFVSPLNTASGMGLASLSLALALGQIAVGTVQPAIGQWSDRRGAVGVVAIGALLLAATTALPALWPMAAVVFVALIANAAAASAVASNGPLLGAIDRAAPGARAGLAAGIVGAGGSAGQLLFGPLTTSAIQAFGWRAAMLMTATVCLVAVPLARLLRAAPSAAARVPSSNADLLRDRRFWAIAGSFGACGFHVAFLAMHMPGVIERCGLPASLAGTWIALAGAANIAGSLAVGLVLKRFAPARLLGALYAARAVAITLLLCVPATPAAMLAFAAAMGLTYMATLPPTAQIVARQHGAHRLGAALDLVMAVHQVGAFAGVWLGGWAAERTGSDRLLWSVDIALALLAAALALVLGRPAGDRGPGWLRRTMQASAGRLAWRSSRRSACAPRTTASASPTPSAAAVPRS